MKRLAMSDPSSTLSRDESGTRRRILTWHVHGNYLYYLSQVPHDFIIITQPGNPPGYGALGNALPWGDNIREVPHDRIQDEEIDCVLFQSRVHYERDQHRLLSAAQRAVPRIYLEHDPPQEHPTDTRHPFQDPDGLLVHVTPFNALMWDSGITPAQVIEHGVVLPPGVRYRGDLARGITVVNHLSTRGRRLGADIYARAASRLPIDLIGMGAEEMGGLGEVSNLAVPDYVSRYRFFFNPIRYTSLGLAVVEAMMSGVPVVGLATTELATVIESGVNGYIDTRESRLIEVMQGLLDDPQLARAWGEAGRLYAEERFGIGRFVQDWLALFDQACARSLMQEDV
jgi:glycosyltransferase involved in cell wall biosynthesis